MEQAIKREEQCEATFFRCEERGRLRLKFLLQRKLHQSTGEGGKGGAFKGIVWQQKEEKKIGEGEDNGSVKKRKLTQMEERRSFEWQN
jgi:hypothetical protein